MRRTAFNFFKVSFNSMILIIVVLQCLISCNSEEQNFDSNFQNENDSLSAVDTIQLEEELQISTTNDTSLDIHAWYQTIDTFLLGDINSDKIKDTAIITSPVRKFMYGCRDDECATKISFSFTDSTINLKEWIGVYNFWVDDDLDRDGIKEIGIVPDSYMGCWAVLDVYSMRNDSWFNIGSASIYACGVEDFSDHVEINDRDRFKLISDDVHGDDNIDSCCTEYIYFKDAFKKSANDND